MKRKQHLELGWYSYNQSKRYPQHLQLYSHNLIEKYNSKHHKAKGDNARVDLESTDREERERTIYLNARRNLIGEGRCEDPMKEEEYQSSEIYRKMVKSGLEMLFSWAGLWSLWALLAQS